MNKKPKLFLSVVLLALLLTLLFAAFLWPHLRADNRGVDPETGQRYGVPSWFTRDDAAFRALADFPVWGIDISYWQGANFDLQEKKDDGATFVIIRQAHGLVEDSLWRLNVSKAESAGLFYGHYHYIEPAVASAKTQAAFYCSLLQQSVYQLPPVLDVEDRGGKTPDQLADYLQEFADIVQGCSGKVPMIYTRATFWNECVADRPDWQEYYLWIARYVTVPDWPYPPYVPRDWPGEHDWSLWQWTSTVCGYGSLDCNVYDGNLLQFMDEFELDVDGPDRERFVIPPGRYEISVDENGNIVFDLLFDLYLPVITQELTP